MSSLAGIKKACLPDIVKGLRENVLYNCLALNFLFLFFLFI